MGERSGRDIALLLDVMLAAKDGQSFIGGPDFPAFAGSRLRSNAVIRSIEVIGGAAGKVSADFCIAHPEIPWREITGMRHRLIHGDAEVRLDLVWHVASVKLPSLIAELEKHVPSEGNG